MHAANSVSSESTILVGDVGDYLWIRVDGKGSFKNSPDLKSYTHMMLDNGNHRFVVDLKHCPVMDSTFMGTLTGIALRVHGHVEGSLRVVNANERNLQLLRSLGLDQIFDVVIEPGELHEERNQVESALLRRARRATLDQIGHAEHVLNAHQTLTEVNSENEERFRDVLTYLRSERKSAE